MNVPSVLLLQAEIYKILGMCKKCLTVEGGLMNGNIDSLFIARGACSDSAYPD